MGACGGVGAADRRWVESARDAGVTEECKSPHGKSAEATRKAHKKGEIAIEAGLTTGEVALKAASFVAKGSALFGLGSLAASSGVMLYGYYKSIAEAAELKEAHQRDAINLAVVWTASAALPKDYVARVGHELREVAGERGGASRILTPLMKDDVKWQKLKAEAEAYARMGRKTGARSGITSPRELAYRLEHDKTFSRAYSSNIAFRHGVDSVVFEYEQARIAKGK